MMEDVALSRTFGEEVGRYFHELLESKGIELVGGEELEAFLGEGRVSAVRTKSGREIEGDVVVVGAGVHPDVRLAAKAGLEVDNGVVCDERLQTSVEGIYAAGDLCSYQSVVHGRRLRVEHWDVALQQGQYAGKAMLGEEEPYDVVPYFFSDLADWASLRVRRSGRALGRGRVARGPRRGRVQRVVPGRRQGGGHAGAGALRRPYACATADRVGGGRVGPAGCSFRRGQ